MGWGGVAEMNEYIVLFEYSLVQAGTVLNSGTLAYGTYVLYTVIYQMESQSIVNTPLILCTGSFEYQWY